MSSYFAPEFDVKIQGFSLEADVRGAVADLTVETSVETAGMATLRLHDPNLTLIDSALFEPGKAIDIQLGYANELQQVFVGEITAVQPDFPATGAPSLFITAYDKSHRMRHNSPARFTFTAMNDAAIVTRIALDNQLIPVVVPSIMPPRESVQQTGSDWALLKELADRNGYDVYVTGSELHFRPPLPADNIVVLRRGKNLSSFAPRLSTSNQSLFQIVRGYDPLLDQAIVSVLSSVSLASDLDGIVERLGSAAIEQLKGMGRRIVRDQPAGSFIEATVLAKVALSRLLDGFYEARGACVGNPLMRAGAFIEVAGVGRRYSGRFRLSKVTHTINGSGFRTTFEISPGRAGSLLESLRSKVQDEPPPNRQENIYAPIVAKVVSNYDPLHPAQVQVSFPGISDDNRSAWARVVSPLAGDNAGTYFLPDIGDEVLVVFENGEINKPRVLGGSWNGRQRPPAEAMSPENAVKMIRTKGGHLIKFDDSSGRERLCIMHKSGSQILFDARGNIAIESTGSLSIAAKNNGDVHIEGNSITLKSRAGPAVTATLKDGTLNVS